MTFNFAAITTSSIDWSEAVNGPLIKGYLIGEDGQKIVGKVAYAEHPRQWLVWSNEGKFWSSYGRTRAAAVAGARRDGII